MCYNEVMFGGDIGSREEETNFCTSSRNSGTCISVLLITEHNLKTLPGYGELLEVYLKNKQTLTTSAIIFMNATVAGIFISVYRTSEATDLKNRLSSVSCLHNYSNRQVFKLPNYSLNYGCSFAKNSK